jgi:radical SAM protein with 4Fe4S-binding SPASM domain
MPLSVAQERIAAALTTSPYAEVEICIFGGEPFLEFETLRKICEWTWEREWQRHYRIYVNSNGTVLTDEIKAWLSRNRTRISVPLSVDGTKLSHDRNRSNSYDRIDLEYFRSTWPDQSVKMTISPVSLDRLASDVIAVHGLGFYIQECNFAVGLDWSDEAHPARLRRELELLCDFYLSHSEITPAPILNVKIASCENKRVYQKWCGAGRQLTTIDTDGVGYPCHFLTPMAFQKDDLDFLLGTDFTDIRKLVDQECLESCYLYPLCPTCYAADFAITGAVNRKNRTICELIKISAYYTAVLAGKRILRTGIGDLGTDDRVLLYKKIHAIKKISELYKDTERIGNLP